MTCQTDGNIKANKEEIKAALKLITAKGEMGAKEEVFTEEAVEGAGAVEVASKAL